MNGMVTFLVTVVAAAVILPYADGIECYACEGYDYRAGQDISYNNQYCPQEDFNRHRIGVSHGSYCFAEIRYYPGYRITKRGIGLGTHMIPEGRTIAAFFLPASLITFSGYYCNTSLCNVMDPALVVSAAPNSPAPTFLQLVFLYFALSLLLYWDKM